MRRLRQITVVGLGLLGGSVTLAVLRCFSGVKAVGYTHRAATRKKARQLGVASEVCDDIGAAVRDADIVILATPIYTFEEIFGRISKSLPAGCVVTDVGSAKALPHRWAASKLPDEVHYVGSHPIAGSEQRGVEFARDDLFDRALCILTRTKKTSSRAVTTLRRFWSQLGCHVESMTPAQHDRIFANVSHVPHVASAALINANNDSELKFAGAGFIDSSRIASGPANIWTDVLLANSGNVTRGIDNVVAELTKLKKAVKNGDEKQIQKLLERARRKRNGLMNYKIKHKEIIS